MVNKDCFFAKNKKVVVHTDLNSACTYGITGLTYRTLVIHSQNSTTFSNNLCPNSFNRSSLWWKKHQL